MLHAFALSALIERCAPHVGRVTMSAIVQVESGGDPLAIGDNTTRESYHPRDRGAAEELARELVAAGHSVDLGIAQINQTNLGRLGLNLSTVFDPCANLGAASAILAQNYAIAKRRFGAGQVALRHALGMYNAGSLDAGANYVGRVMLAAGIRETHRATSRLSAAREALRSPLFVRARIAARKSRTLFREAIAPRRAPILVTITRAPRARVLTAER
jgi:type IV secretion system protein VirB1